MMLSKMYKLIWELSIYSSDFVYFCKDKMSSYKMCLPPLYEYLNHNGIFLAKTVELIKRGITVLAFIQPAAKHLANPTEWEKLCSRGASARKNADKYFEISGMSKIYSRDVYEEILKHPVLKVKEKNYYRHVEQSSKYVNVDSFGHRPTESFPKSPYNTIHIFGDSIGDTWEMADQHTLTNQLQELVKDKYRVINYSIGGTDCYQTGLNMLDVDFETEDVVIFICVWYQHLRVEDDLNKIGVPIIDLLPYYNRPRANEIFIDWDHPNPNGYKIMADAIYEAIQNAQKDTTVQQLSSPTLIRNKTNLNLQSNTDSPYLAELSPWINEISTLRPKIGSIIMNCNPFTLGHRYLIEQSSAKVDKLFVFVVEEDKSIFPFADSIELVRKGTADLPNVTVLPSGKFIISSLTFSDYFEKSEMQDRVIDSSMDVRIFGEHIAPALGINIRFAGEEPLDTVTRQYNETMTRILPKYGIDFEVIPRKEHDGEVISASRVRKLLEAKDYDAISQIVPKTTLTYLMSKYV